MNGETYQDEQDYQIQLALARQAHQQESRLGYLRERVKEQVKEEAKQYAKQQAKKLAAQATKAVARMLIQLIMQGIRMIVVFLVATPPGWVVDIVILIIIVSVVIATDAGGIRTAIWNYGCGGGILGGLDPTGLYRGLNQGLCAAESLGVGFLGGKGNPLW